jgi:pimeloyl-ACP methyl ester carboxylesterase
MSLRRTLGSLTLGLVLAAFGSAAYSSPVEPAPSSSRADCLSNGVGVDSYCMVGGVRLHFVDWGGQGPAVMLLTGLGNSARIYDELAPRLAAGHRVIVLTRRGYGRSDAAQDYSNTALVGDVLGLMDGLAIPRASFIGHSIAGGELSTLGADHPDRVERLIYLDSAYDRTQALALEASVPPGAPPQPRNLSSPKAYAAWRAAVLQTGSPAVAHDVADLVNLDVGRVTPRTSRAIMLSILAGDIAAPPRYAAIPAPALAIYTSKDVLDQVAPNTDPKRRGEILAYSLRTLRPWMLRAQADFLEHKACGVAIELPHSTHYFYLRNPAATTRLLLAYLATRTPCNWKAPGDLQQTGW